jgi:hypothetical protein
MCNFSETNRYNDMKTLALEFGTNLFGKLSTEVKERLQAVIDNPCQETWEDAYSIILNSSGKMTTLWQAVIKFDWDMQQSKPCDKPWSHIPTQETIIKAINDAILSKQNLN